MTARAISARYAGTCRCGAQFGRGESIQYDREMRAVVGCFTCKAAPQQPDASDIAYEDQCAAACGLDRDPR